MPAVPLKGGVYTSRACYVKRRCGRTLTHDVLDAGDPERVAGVLDLPCENARPRRVRDAAVDQRQASGGTECGAVRTATIKILGLQTEGGRRGATNLARG